MTAAEFLVEKKILLSTDLDTQWNIQLTRDTHIHSTKELVKAIEEYSSIQLEQEKAKYVEAYAIFSREHDKNLLLYQKILLLQTALREIRDFSEDSEWDNPGEIAKDALTIQ